MKKLIIFLSLIFALSSCNDTSKSPDLYYDINLQIVSINDEDSLSQNKFHTPRTCNIILFCTTSEPIQYMEYNTCDDCNCNGSLRNTINTEWLYNHKPGDIVHFDYVRKNRFFTIKNR